MAGEFSDRYQLHIAHYDPKCCIISDDSSSIRKFAKANRFRCIALMEGYHRTKAGKHISDVNSLHSDLKDLMCRKRSNARLQEGAGVCGIIFEEAGPIRLQKECDKIGGCRTGSAVITPGFDLCKYIIHAVGPVYKDGNHHEPQDLYSCYRTSLDIARGNRITSVAFPLISTGIFGYPKKEAWRKALQACDDWMEENHDYELQIIFAIIDDQILEMGKHTAEELGIELL